MLVHHTLAAGIYRLMQLLGDFAPLSPARGAQLLSLIWALGIIPIVWMIVRRVVADVRARIMAFLVFGTFTAWVWSSVTIDNDMAMAFWGNLALLSAVIMMQGDKIPSMGRVLLLGLVIGIAATVKATASVMMGPAVLSLMLCGRFSRSRFGPVAGRVLLLILIWGSLASLNYIRHYRATGYLVYHRDLIYPPGRFYPDTRWDYFSFRFPAILKRPFELNPDKGDERTNASDFSFWSKLYVTGWRLPDYLPDNPNPRAASSLYASALPITCIGILGFLAAFPELKESRPGFRSWAGG